LFVLKEVFKVVSFNESVVKPLPQKRTIPIIATVTTTKRVVAINGETDFLLKIFIEHKELFVFF
jgi:hypothetical protein